MQKRTPWQFRLFITLSTTVWDCHGPPLSGENECATSSSPVQASECTYVANIKNRLGGHWEVSGAISRIDGRCEWATDGSHHLEGPIHLMMSWAMGLPSLRNGGHFVKKRPRHLPLKRPLWVYDAAFSPRRTGKTEDRHIARLRGRGVIKKSSDTFTLEREPILWGHGHF